MERDIYISGKEIEGKIQLSYSDGVIGAKLSLDKAPNIMVYRCYLQNAAHDTVYLGICEPKDSGLGLSANVRGDEQFDRCLITIGRMDEAYQVAAFGEYEQTEAEVAEIEDTGMEESDAVEDIFDEAEIACETDLVESNIEELEKNQEVAIAEIAGEDSVGEETAADDGAVDEEEIEEMFEFDEDMELDEIIKRPIGFDIPKCAMAEETEEEAGVLDEQDECEQTESVEEVHTTGSCCEKETFDYLGLSFVKCDNIMNEQMSELEKRIFMYDGINYAFQMYGFVLRAYDENAVIYAIPSNMYKDPHPILHLALYASYHNIRAFGSDGYFIIGVDKQKDCYFTVIDE